jgi:WD40 repeat protein
VAFSADGRRAFACSEDGLLYCWDVASGQQLASLGTGRIRLRALACTPNGREVLVACQDGALRAWDVDSGAETYQLRGHRAAVLGLALSPGGRHAVSAGNDGMVYLWDLRDHRPLASFGGNQSANRVAGLSPDCRRIVSVGGDRAIRLWDIATRRDARRLESDNATVAQVLFTPDGRRLLSGNADKTVRLWDAASGKEVWQFLGHTAEVTCVAVSPDGRHALSGSSDKTLRLWDLDREESLAVLKSPSEVRSVAFAPDGRQALSGHVNGDVLLWPLPGSATPTGPTVREKTEPPLPGIEEPPMAGPPPKPAPRLPVPGKTARDQAEAALDRKILSKGPARTRDARLKLIAELRKEVGNVKADTATRYALWTRARDLAAREAEIRTALDIVGELAGVFEIQTVSEKVATLKAVGPHLANPARPGKPQQVTAWRNGNRDLAEHALGLAEDALAIDAIGLVWQAVDLAIHAARRVGNAGLLERANALWGLSAQVPAALASLKADPRSPEASLTVGKFRALSQNRWTEALPLLAQASEPRWKAAAQLDLAQPGDAAGRVAVGDAWWKLGQEEKGRARARLYWRACVWYERARPGLDDPVRSQVEARIASVRGAPALTSIKPWSDADLTNPNSGFPTGTDWTGDKGYKDGHWFMSRGPGWMYRATGHCPRPFACRVVGRLVDAPAEGWLLEFSGVVFRIDSEGVFHRGYPGGGEEIRHRVIRPHGEMNELLIVVRGRLLEIYINGLAVRDPLILDRDVWPTEIGLRLDARGGNGVKAEFDRFTLWPADDLPTLESRAADVK